MRARRSASFSAAAVFACRSSEGTGSQPLSVVSSPHPRRHQCAQATRCRHEMTRRDSGTHLCQCCTQRAPVVVGCNAQRHGCQARQHAARALLSTCAGLHRLRSGRAHSCCGDSGGGLGGDQGHSLPLEGRQEVGGGASRHDVLQPAQRLVHIAGAVEGDTDQDAAVWRRVVGVELGTEQAGRSRSPRQVGRTRSAHLDSAAADIVLASELRL